MLQVVLKQSSVGLTERELRQVLKEVDSDEDGSVSFAEYLRLAQRLSEKENKTKATAKIKKNRGSKALSSSWTPFGGDFIFLLDFIILYHILIIV